MKVMICRLKMPLSTTAAHGLHAVLMLKATRKMKMRRRITATPFLVAMGV
jgi:hypothetical protein